MAGEQDAARRLVRKMLLATGLTPSELAAKAGLAHSTLTRFLNSADAKHTLSFRTLLKLSKVSGVPIPATLAMSADIDMFSRVLLRIRPERRSHALKVLEAFAEADEDVPPAEPTAAPPAKKRGRR